MYHLAWEGTPAELDVMHDRLVEAGALIGMSDHGANNRCMPQSRRPRV